MRKLFYLAALALSTGCATHRKTPVTELPKSHVQEETITVKNLSLRNQDLLQTAGMITDDSLFSAALRHVATEKYFDADWDLKHIKDSTRVDDFTEVKRIVERATDDYHWDAAQKDLAAGRPFNAELDLDGIRNPSRFKEPLCVFNEKLNVRPAT